MERLRLAILDHSPDLGGAEFAILTLLRNMDRSRFETTVILPCRGAFSEALEKIDIPVVIIRLPMGLLRLKRGKAFLSFFILIVSLIYLQFYLLKLCFYLKKNRFHLVLTNTIKAHLYGSLAACLCSIPLVWRFHDLLVAPDFSPFLIGFISLFGRLFPKKIYAVSGVSRDYLIKSGIAERKTEVIFNAVDSERFEIKRGFKSIRDEYHLGKAKLVGCIGRIVPQKGQKVLLSAIPGVIQSYREAFFLIVGDIFLKEGAYQKELFEITNRNGIGEKVKWTGFRADIGNVMDSLDIVVFPSIAPEAFPLSVLEAMSLGKPVIASSVGGVKEIIEDGVSGLLVEPNRPDQITEKILFLFQDPEICDRIGKKAREVIGRKFPLKNYVSSMEQACQKFALKEARVEGCARS
jgi:glycosyltransferase involved in cell wall biosynthesis